MKREKVLELLSATESLIDGIGDIIDYDDYLMDKGVVNGLSLPWALEESSGMIYYARNEGGDIYEYSGFQVSSLGMKNEKFYMGESDGITYVMGYPEDENWDDTYILILDNNNKESLTIDE